MENKTVKIIDTGYNVLREVEDGGTVTYQRPDGTKKTVKLKYGDEAHFYLDGNCYHRMQWAEAVKRNGLILV